MRIGIRHLQHILCVNDSHDLVDASLENRHARKRPRSQQLNKFFDTGITRHNYHFRPRLHRFACSFFAKLHNRLNQIAVALIQDSFLLPGFDQRVHGVGLCLRLFLRVFAGQGCHRLQETEDQRDGEHQIDQNLNQEYPSQQPLAFRTREINEWQKAVEYDHDQDQSQDRFENLFDAPAAIAENSKCQDHRDCGHE